MNNIKPDGKQKMSCYICQIAPFSFAGSRRVSHIFASQASRMASGFRLSFLSDSTVEKEHIQKIPQ
jgi:hypothetical protein